MTDEGDAALAGLSDDEFRRHLEPLSTAEIEELIDGWLDGEAAPFVQFIPLLDEALAGREHDVAWAGCWSSIAGWLFHLGCYAEAIEAHDQAQPVYVAHEQFISAAICQMNRANALQELGRFAEAIEAYDQAEPVLVAHEQFISAANCQTNRAVALRRLGRFAEAIEAYDQAEPVFVAHEEFILTARCQMNRGSALLQLGRFAEAIEAYDQAEPVFAAHEQFISAALCPMNRGNVLQELGRFAEAIEAYDQAEPVFAAHEQFISAARCRMNRANALRQLGHYAEAIEAYDQAEPVFTAQKQFIDTASCQTNRGNALQNLGRFPDAIAAYDQAEPVFVAHKQFIDAADCQMNRGNALRKLRRFIKAIAAYDQAEPAYAAHEQFISAARCQMNRASALRDLGRYAEALEAFLAACTTLEQALTRVGGDAEMASGLRGELRDPYLPAIELLLADAIEADHDDRMVEAAKLREQAFALGERGRSARLREELSRRLVEIDLDLEGEDSTLVAKWKALRAELAELDARLRKQGEAGTLSLAAERELQDPQRTSILRALDALERELFVVSSELADLVSPQLPSLEDLRADLAPDEVVIAFLLAPKGSTLVRFCIDSDGLASASLSDQGRDVRDELAKLAACVASCEKQDGRPEAGSAGDARFWQEPLQELGQLLLGGLEEDPRTSGWLTGGNKRLTFVPSSALFDLPFAALGLPGRDRYEALVSCKELEVAVSPQSFTRLYQKGKGEKSSGSVAVVNPDGRLTSTGDEIAALRDGMPQIVAHHGDTNTAGGHPITAEDFPKLITGHSLVHLTCHGEAEPRSPMQSKLLFAADAEGNPTSLTALQVYGRLRGQHELFFAAACESGEAQVLSGDEALGMHRALLYRSRQVVTTLYQVSHRATLILEQIFYAHYAQSRDAVAALAAAQRAFLDAGKRHDDGAPAHEHDVLFAELQSPENPYFWAGLQVMG